MGPLRHVMAVVSFKRAPAHRMNERGRGVVVAHRPRTGSGIGAGHMSTLTVPSPTRIRGTTQLSRGAERSLASRAPRDAPLATSVAVRRPPTANPTGLYPGRCSGETVCPVPARTRTGYSGRSQRRGQRWPAVSVGSDTQRSSSLKSSPASSAYGPIEGKRAEPAAGAIRVPGTQLVARW